ncbi:MAG: DUF2461 domain-containing protein [Saprospiraceae bacterium]|nr:DUF2461 domain-containing protein [Saprospiraceae bacterium]
MKKSTLSFLKELEKNNDREWFAEHKNLYTAAREDVISFVEKLKDEMTEFDKDIWKVDAQKALFRIYRDTRFSQNKAPYKTNFGANLAYKNAGYYLHIQPEKSFLERA